MKRLLIEDPATGDTYYTGNLAEGKRLIEESEFAFTGVRDDGTHYVHLCFTDSPENVAEWGNGPDADTAWRFALGAAFGPVDEEYDERTLRSALRKKRKPFSFLLVLATLAVLGAALGALLTPSAARADQIEPATSDVVKVNVVYAEPMPTHDTPNRQYFETNDGAAYRYIGYRACVRDGAVPTRVCRTVFWYAR